MIASFNIYGKDKWAIKITSLLAPGEASGEYDENNYDEAPPRLPWIIAEEDGALRTKISSTLLEGSNFATLHKGLDDLEGVTYGKGLVIGTGSLVRPTTTIGDFVYIGAGTIIDIDCIIEDEVTIGDNGTITEGSHIEKGSVIKSGTII